MLMRSDPVSSRKPGDEILRRHRILAEHLQELNTREQNSPVFAYELARLHRSMGDTAMALHEATRAVQISPYDADYREQAAAIAIESGRLDLARMHILAMTLLEPGQSRHRTRLEAIDRLME